MVLTQLACRQSAHPPCSSILGAACPPPYWLMEGRGAGRNGLLPTPPLSSGPSPVGCILNPHALIQLFSYPFVYLFTIRP